MKRIFVFGFALFLFACTPMQQAVAPLQELPSDGRTLVLIVVTAGVTWLLLKLSELAKVDLSGHSGAVAAALAPVLITIIEHFLQLIPPVFDNVVLSIIHLVVLLVGSLGTWFLVKRQTPTLH
ncbi:MAG TPA: hypothetical protein VFC02_22565 [Anaerolineales bacterium]|nr:hypothetical protein [Anaerolineales bacterium]